MKVHSNELPRGHLYVAMGQQYDIVAAHSVKRLRKFSDLPVQVITNLKRHMRSPIWRECENVIFTSVKLRDDENRLPKCQPDLFSIFKETLYTDADTLIHSEKFVRVFDLLSVADISIAMCSLDDSRKRLRGAKLYKQAIQDFRPAQICFVYHPGVLAFKKNKHTRVLFSLWYEYWSKRKLRDMPCLVCAIGNTPKLVYAVLPRKEFGFINSTVIQHFSGKNKPKTKHFPDYTKILVDESVPLHRMTWVPRKAFKS